MTRSLAHPLIGAADDQATRLRALMASTRPGPEAPPASTPVPAIPLKRALVVAVSSGKGGVGKTSLCVNLAIALQSLGHASTLLDADLGMANADVLCGLVPARRLDALWSEGRRRVLMLSDIAVEAPGGFRLVPGAVGVERMADLGPADRARLLTAMGELERHSDVIVVDTGAGMGRGVTCFLRAADLAVVVATPEPTSITDAYALLKCVVAPAGAQSLRQEREPRVALVVNQVTGEREARSVHARIGAVSDRFLKYPLPLLGWVAQDVRVASAVRKKRPVLLEFPRCAASRDLRRLGETVARVLGPSEAAAGDGRAHRGLAWMMSRLFLRGG